MACRRLDHDQFVIYCWFFCEITVLILVGVSLWLSLTPRNPRLTVSAAHLDSTNHTLTRSLLVHLQIFNPNNHMGIDYSSIVFKLYAGGGILAMESTSGFLQGYKNTTLFHMPAQTTQEFWKAMNDTSTVDLILRMEAAFRFRIIKWRTKVRHIACEERLSKAIINLNGTLHAKR